MAFHPALSLTGRSRGLTYSVPTHGESANRFPGWTRGSGPAEAVPTARALGPHEARSSSRLPASLFALVFPWADVLPGAHCGSDWRDLSSPSVFRPRRATALTPRSRWRLRGAGGPRRSLGWWPQPAGCLHGFPRLRAGVVLSGKGELTEPPPGSASRAEGWAPCSVLLGVTAASLLPGWSGASWAKASS